MLVVGGGFTGLWTAWYAAASSSPTPGSSLLEADRLRPRPERSQRRLLQRDVVLAADRCASAGATRPALAVARAAEEAVGRIGEFCEEQGVDAWFRHGRLHAGLDRRPPTTASGSAALEACRELGVAGGDAAARAAAEVAARCASPAFRDGAFCPSSATVQPARLALGLRDRLRAAGVEIFESSPVRSLPRRRRTGSRRGPPAASVRAGARGARDRRRRQGPARAAARPAHRRLLPHRPHRAGAGRARGGRLDRRRVHHRQPRPARLLPHHSRRPDRLRLGRRPDRDGRAARTAAPRSTPRSIDGDRGAPARVLPRPRGASGSPTPGAARSTPRRPTCRWCCRCAAAAPSPPPATPATASGPRTWSAAPSPRSPSTAATSPPASPSSTPRHAAGPPRALPLDRRRGDPPRDHGQGGGRDGRPPPPASIASAVAKVPELIGFHIGR